ncbi:MAG TPA: extracellular solute-binding protein [Capillimicrobium sp.]|jgi:putative spermidine/putrescine transport system substrate-binding protein
MTSTWKRRIAAPAAAVLAATALAACGSDDDGGSTSAGTTVSGGSGSGGAELVVGGWGGAYNKATQKHYIEPWAAESGGSVQFVDAPAAQVAQVEAQNRAGSIEWDMIDSIAGPDAFVLADRDLLEPLPADLRSELESTLGEGKVTDFGFTMGNLSYVVACNRDKVERCPETVSDFFDVEGFPGKREAPAGAPLMMMTMAAVANGTDPASTQTAEPDVDAAFATLDQVKDSIAVYWESGDQSEQVMRSGEADIGLIWSGRAYRLADDGMNLDIAVEGGAYEPGYWTVVKGSDNTEQAFDLMRSIANNVEGEAAWSTEMEYSVPNPEAIESLPAKQAKRLPDHPDTFPLLAVPNFEWYAQNADDVNRRWQDFVKG